MRLIDADKLIKICRKGWKLFGREDEKLKHWVDENDIRNQPTVDAVPVIRCKDCKHYTGKWCKQHSTKELDLNDRVTTDYDYCSWAERKEE